MHLLFLLLLLLLLCLLQWFFRALLLFTFALSFVSAFCVSQQSTVTTTKAEQKINFSLSFFINLHTKLFIKWKKRRKMHKVCDDSLLFLAFFPLCSAFSLNAENLRCFFRFSFTAKIRVNETICNQHDDKYFLMAFKEVQKWKLLANWK